MGRATGLGNGSRTGSAFCASTGEILALGDTSTIGRAIAFGFGSAFCASIGEIFALGDTSTIGRAIAFGFGSWTCSVLTRVASAVKDRSSLSVPALFPVDCVEGE